MKKSCKSVRQRQHRQNRGTSKRVSKKDSSAALVIREIETKTTPKEHEPCWLELQVYNYLVNNVAFFKETGCVHQSATAA